MGQATSMPSKIAATISLRRHHRPRRCYAHDTGRAASCRRNTRFHTLLLISFSRITARSEEDIACGADADFHFSDGYLKRQERKPHLLKALMPATRHAIDFVMAMRRPIYQLRLYWSRKRKGD